MTVALDFKDDLISKVRESDDNKGMIMTFEDATAKIANAVEIRDMKHDRNLINSCMKSGLGRNLNTVQPLVISRKLGHPELIFNDTDQKNVHFKVNSAAKWARMQSSECWICD
jgi:hypothetical protein